MNGRPTKTLPVAGPSITQKEIDYVTDAVTTAWYGEANKYNSRFEAAFAAYCGRKHAVALPSCTAGLHLALLALGVGPGDEVIVPDVTWIASAAPISYVGATPVFVDIDRESWCLDPSAFEEAITDKTKAAIVVDLYGALPNWDELQEIADRRSIVLIEDAAEAVGSRWRERPAGSFGTVSVFSFHGSKTLTTGEGGMLLVDDEALLDRIHRLRDHGRRPGDTMFFNEEVGWKYKMSSLQAALGLAQLERVDELVEGKRRIFQWYRDAFGNGCPGVLNPDVSGLHNSYWMTTLIVDRSLGIAKEELVPKLRARGIDVRPFFYPLSEVPAFRDAPSAAHARARNRNSYELSPLGINLPSALNLSQSDVEFAVSIVQNAVGH